MNYSLQTRTNSIPKVLSPFRNLQPYRASEGRNAFIRMDFNEGPPPAEEFLSRALAQCSYAVTAYPEYQELKQAAAQAWKLNASMVMPINGADEGISLLLRAFTDPGNPLVLPIPAFPMYRIYAEQYETPLLCVPMDNTFMVDPSAVLQTLRKGSALALTSPNNPTGRAIPEADLLAILNASDDKPIIMDETYAPFCEQDFAPLLKRYSNLIILRSLSKSYGLPGLRCGFILADSCVIQHLDILRAPFNVNVVAAKLGAQVISGDTSFRKRTRRAVEARRRLQARLDATGIRTVPSDAHFFMADLGDEAQAAIALLLSKNILIKNLATSLPGMVRISVADESQAQAFEEAFLPWWSERTTKGARP